MTHHPPGRGDTNLQMVGKFLRFLAPSTSSLLDDSPSTSCLLQLMNRPFVLFLPTNAATCSVAATSTVATYIPGRFAAWFSPRHLRVRPFVSVRPLPRVWDSTLCFNFEIGVCLVRAWAIPCALCAAPGGGGRYNLLAWAINNKSFQFNDGRDSPQRCRTAARVEQGDLFKFYACSRLLISAHLWYKKKITANRLLADRVLDDGSSSRYCFLLPGESYAAGSRMMKEFTFCGMKVR